jgi:hypothetical protein
MLFLSACGPISYVEQPLVRYRRHGMNSSGLFSNMESKAEYYSTRCRSTEELLDRFESYFPTYPDLPAMRECNHARLRGSVPGLWKYRRLIPDLYRFEIALALCPDPLFRIAKTLYLRLFP